MVNSLETTVSVGSGTAHLENLTNTDLTDEATFVNGIKVDAVVKPSCTVRDLSRTYKKGTTAGFVVTLDNSLIKLGVGDLPMQIYFFKDGNSLGHVTCPQKGGDLLKLDVGSITSLTYEFTAVAPADFDEIGLVAPGLLNLSVISGIKVKYAFVGKNGKYFIDSEEGNGIKAYETAVKKMYPGTIFNNDNLSLGQCNSYTQNEPYATGELINSDPTDSRLIGVDALIDVPAPATVSAYGGDSSDNMPFKAGMTVGFELGGADILKVISGISITTYTMKPNPDYEGKIFQKKYIWTKFEDSKASFTLLGVNLGVDGRRDVSLVLNKDCNAVMVRSNGVLGIGATRAYRMFVVLPPEVDEDTQLSVSADRSLCDEKENVTLQSDEAVTWRLSSYPSGADISKIKVTNASNSLSCVVSGFVTAGDYVFTATASDGRTATTTVTYGISPVINAAIKPWVNNFTEHGVTYSADKDQYKKWYNLTSFSLTPLISTNLANLVTPTLEDYASIGGVSLVSKNLLCGVFRSTPYTPDGKVNVGFVTRTKWTGLDLTLLSGMKVKVYNSGDEVKTISSKNTHFKVLSADLIGNDNYVTTEYSVEVDQNTPFDAITLWEDGLLSAQVSSLNVYYAFVEPSAKAQDYDKAVNNSWVLISNSGTGATIDASKLAVGAGAVSAISTSSNLTHIIDGDLTTHATIAGLANVGNGYTVPVKLGRVFDAGHQVQIITSNQNLLNVKLIDIVKLKAYRNGTEVASKANWQVLGANVLSGVNKESEIIWTPVDDKGQPVAFDEISISFINVANVAGDMEIYGIRVTNDADGDGIADVNDDQSCDNAYLIDENEGGENESGLNKTHDYKHGILNLRRYMSPDLTKAEGGQWYTICLPVDLTFNQFISAFGNDARLAKPVDFEDAKPKTLMFNIDEVYGNNVLLSKNTPYIIFLGNNQTDSIQANGSNSTIDTEMAANDNGVSSDHKGKGVYIINGVDYDMTENSASVTSIECKHKTTTSVSVPDVTWHGTFHKNTSLPSGFYTFSADGMLTKYNYNNVTYFRGLRCWMTENSTSAKGTDYDVSIFGKESDPTLIQGLFVAPNEVTGDVYTVEGLKVKSNAASLEGLPQGVYIWNHKKVMVK